MSRVSTRCETIPPKDVFSRVLVTCYEATQSNLRLIFSQTSLIALDRFRDVSIPDVNGRTKRQVSSQLRAMGLNIGTKYTYVNDIGKDVD